MLRAEAGHVGVELLPLDREVVVAEPGSDPLGGPLRSGRSGAAVGVVPGELGRELDGRGPVEGRRKAPRVA
jgi:hypothetical protein